MNRASSFRSGINWDRVAVYGATAAAIGLVAGAAFFYLVVNYGI